MKTENNLEIKTEAEERKLHRTSKVYDFLEMWHRSHNWYTIEKKSDFQNKQMSGLGHIWDTDEIVKTSW